MFWNAPASIIVTVAGTVTFVSFVPLNACSPMVNVPLGKESSPEIGASAKAKSPIFRRLSEKVTEVSPAFSVCVSGLKAYIPISATPVKSTSFRLLQYAKAYSPIEVIESCHVIEVRLLQLLNA